MNTAVLGDAKEEEEDEAINVGYSGEIR